MARDSQTPKSNRPGKTPQVAACVRRLWVGGHYIFSAHVQQRMRQRRISQMDIQDVILDGVREPAKDEYNVGRHAWHYAFRHRDVDGRDLRVAVTLEGEKLVVVLTAIGVNED